MPWTNEADCHMPSQGRVIGFAELMTKAAGAAPLPDLEMKDTLTQKP